MEVNAYVYKEARKDNIAENYSRRYRDRTGAVIVERLFVQSKSDFSDMTKERISEDHGKTWSDWKVISAANDTDRNQGVHQRTQHQGPTIWNAVHGHYVSLHSQEIWVGGYDAATVKYWSGDIRDDVMHAFITVSTESEILCKEMVRYQEGDDFDPEDWTKASYTQRNVAFATGNVVVDDNGDILFTIEAPMRYCCESLGKDINEVFPSKPDFPNGIIVMRGTWNGNRYIFSHGTPIVISDLLSSRGLNEPTMAKLSSGRIVVVMRASNAQIGWDTLRLEPGTPGVKWYAWSDDGGATFSEIMPWHFDDGEIIYSSATCSVIHKDERTGKHYWIGNITDHKVNGNFPRYPLNIVEIDETYGTAKKESFTIIDTRREGEPEDIQLSNFNVLQNRESGKLEIMLTKFGQYGAMLDSDSVFRAEVWRYEITLP